MTTAALPGPFSRGQMRLLAELGFLAAANGQAPAARTLFEALGVLRPESPVPYIGQAMAAIAARSPDEAVRILSAPRLGALRGDGELQAFLGLALVEAGRLSQATATLEALSPHAGSGQPHMRMAARLLDGLRGMQPATAFPKAMRSAHHLEETVNDR